MAALHTVIHAEAWRAALEKYGAATGTAVTVYEAPGTVVLGPVHPTPLFEAVNQGRPDPAMFADCAGRCLAQPDRPTILDEHGVAVIGVPILLAGTSIGAVVAGYGLTAFPEEATVRRFTLRHGLRLPPVWRATRGQAPLTRPRLSVQTELLAALTETLLSANLRAREHEEAAAHLAEAVRSKDRFLAMLAHELRNPLAPIRIAMQIIGVGETARPEVVKAREIVDRQVAHLTRLLDDLLDVSRITSGKIDLRREPVDVAVVVANALETTRTALRERNHTVSVSLPEEPLLVDADSVRLEQIVVNLVHNAARYTPPNGHILVAVGRENTDAVVRVRDDGIGIAAHVLPRIFDLFTQADQSLAHSNGGLGIGLTVVQNLVELHGGTVTAESQGPGRGSEFVVRLPVGRAGAGLAEPSPKPALRVPRLRILVIEDNADSRDVLRTLLEVEGHHVEIAEDGLAGLEKARGVRPDAAIVDIGLPGLDGYEVGRRIRQDLGRAVTLLALTGYGQPEDRRRSEEAGFDAHLVKPVTPEQIHEALVKRAAA